MRDSLNECYFLTETLWKLSSMEQADLSDAQINEIINCLDRREQLLPQIVPPFTPEEQKYGKQILIWNKEIDVNLRSIKKGIMIEIQRLKKTEKSTKKYMGYNYGSPDGMFYDKRN